MRTMSRAGLSIFALSAGFLGLSAGSLRQMSSKSAGTSEVNRGKYLVEEVARCTECHTPRDSQGQLDPGRWLQGASIWITPVHPTQYWAQNAPALAGFGAYSDADATNILEKGIGANGEIIRPPMHIYHLSHADAQAIVAYLRSLPAGHD
jgi:mono/diheme cytochrome c family protein